MPHGFLMAHLLFLHRHASKEAKVWAWNVCQITFTDDDAIIESDVTQKFFSVLSDTPRVDVVDGTNYWTRSRDDNFSCPCLASLAWLNNDDDNGGDETSVVSKWVHEWVLEEEEGRKADPHLKFDQHLQSVLANVFTSTNRLIKNHEFTLIRTSTSCVSEWETFARGMH
jgi:hypothetical protein